MVAAVVVVVIAAMVAARAQTLAPPGVQARVDCCGKAPAEEAVMMVVAPESRDYSQEKAVMMPLDSPGFHNC